jgi:hypothetical protein
VLGIGFEPSRHDRQADGHIVSTAQDVKMFNIWGRAGNPSFGRMLVAIMDHDLPAWIGLIGHRSDHSRPFRAAGQISYPLRTIALGDNIMGKIDKRSVTSAVNGAKSTRAEDARRARRSPV